MDNNALNVNPVIKLSETRVLKIEFESFTLESSITKDFNLNLDTVISKSENNPNLFVVNFNVTLTSKAETGFCLKISFVGLFESAVPVDDKFLDSPFASVNAPAIAFPFLRSYVVGILANAGYTPLIMPALNFQAMYNDKKKREEEKKKEEEAKKTDEPGKAAPTV